MISRLHVLRILGTTSKDPARTLRTYASSLLEGETGQIGQEGTLVNTRTRTPSPLPSSSDQPHVPLPYDERRLLAKKKKRLQRDLLHAAREGDYLDVSILLSEGAETEWTEENEGKTALIFAAQYGHLRVAELLIEAGADLEARSDAFGDDWIIRTEKDRTPLIWAAAGRDCHLTQERMCRLLLDKGADANARNIYARTALQEASMSVRFNNIDPRPTMQVLLEHGAFVNACDMNSWTALTECGHYGRLDVAEYLLAHGAQVDGRTGEDDPAFEGNPRQTKIRETPLVVCAEWAWNEDLICLLLDKGADTQATNKEGKTMRELATEAKRGVVLDALERAWRLQSQRQNNSGCDDGKDPQISSRDSSESAGTLSVHLPTDSADFNQRLSAYLTSNAALRSALDQAITNSYAKQYNK